MKRLTIGVIGVVAMVLLAHPLAAAEKILKMSTTTSTQSSGLLDVLLPEFEKDEGVKVKVIAKGTGAAIRDGMDGNVDVIFVHAKARENDFISQGYGTKRFAIMHNDFVIVGPGGDPAGIRGVREGVVALKKISDAGAMFISRGDDSGTHTKEQFLWKMTELPMSEDSQVIVKKGKKKEIHYVEPSSSANWYVSIGQGMGKTITYADEKQAYTLADRGTYIKYKFGKTPAIDLEILCEGDELLANPYGVIPVSPKKHPHVRFELASKFAEWLTSIRAQKLINDYRLEGKQLFYPDAIDITALK